MEKRAKRRRRVPVHKYGLGGNYVDTQAVRLLDPEHDWSVARAPGWYGVPREVFAHHLVPRLSGFDLVRFAASCRWARGLVGPLLPPAMLRCKLGAIALGCRSEKQLFDKAVARAFGVPKSLRPRGIPLWTALESVAFQIADRAKGAALAVGRAVAGYRARRRALEQIAANLPMHAAVLNHGQTQQLELALVDDKLQLVGGAAWWLQQCDYVAYYRINTALKSGGPEAARRDLSQNPLYLAGTPALYARWADQPRMQACPFDDVQGIVRSLTEDRVVFEPYGTWTMLVRGDAVLRVARMDFLKPMEELCALLDHPGARVLSHAYVGSWGVISIE
jgi:hypothetical protein